MDALEISAPLDAATHISAFECIAFLRRTPAIKPVNTNRAPAAIRKPANAILAIPMDERDHRALRDVALGAPQASTKRNEPPGRRRTARSARMSGLQVGLVADFRRGRGDARRSPLPLIKWFVTPLNCRQDN